MQGHPDRKGPNLKAAGTTNSEQAGDRARRLRQMKRVPLALLGLMVVVFAATQMVTFGGSGYVAAFAEAAIVGALADWFAVTALFRHPLGLPIPHTAIIPRRKDDLAASLSEFVQVHFLQERVLRRHLRDADLAKAVAGWAIRHRDDLADIFTGLARWLVESLGDPKYRQFLQQRLLARFDAEDLAPLAGRLLQLMIENRHHQELFTESLRLAAAFLSENKERIRAQINRGSPWWMPGFIDDRIFDQMVERIQTQLLGMIIDPDHELRRDFDDAMARWARDLLESPETVQALSARGQKIMGDPVLQSYFRELFNAIGETLQANLEARDSSIRAAYRRALGHLAVGALRDGEVRSRLNDWLESGLVYVVTTQGQAMTGIISATVQRWDGAETATRIELQVGKDLQYIRINGTIVGGLIGLVLHAFTDLF
ncbi:MAG: DUF445 domain-containing protein [Xanthomonadales bacterium]|nr:DUF445 domain-containing protein [Xanthomonadales bacterium]